MIVYIAGPMRGLPGCNFAAFDAAAERWRAAGHHPITPTDLDRMLGHGATPDGRFRCVADLPDDMVHTVFALLTCVCRARAIALLPGWERSAGATMELATAQFLGLPVYDAATTEPLAVPRRPWGELADVEAWVGPVLEDPEEPSNQGIIEGSSLPPAAPPAEGGDGDWGDVWRTVRDRIVAREAEEVNG